MKTVAVKNRCRFRIAGKPEPNLEPLPAPSRVAAAPNRIPLIKPRLLVRTGDPVKAGGEVVDERLKGLVTHRASGRYPAGDPGVMHYQTKQSAEENRAWYVNGQDVCLLGENFQSGRFPTTRILSVSGGPSENNRHVRTRIGAPLESLVKQIEAPAAYRWITGGAFTGEPAGPEGFMGLHETALVLIQELEEKELFGFARPGGTKPTCSHVCPSKIELTETFKNMKQQYYLGKV
ncbi:MAG: hypothetical protein ACOCTS_02265 [Thermodesulfobacteriota bacterium]